MEQATAIPLPMFCHGVRGLRSLVLHAARASWGTMLLVKVSVTARGAEEGRSYEQ